MHVEPRARVTSIAALLAVLLPAGAARAADHRDAPIITRDPRADVTDVYAFTSPENQASTVFILTVNPDVQQDASPFDPKLRYELLIDTDGNLKRPELRFVFATRVTRSGDEKVKFAARGKGARGFRGQGNVGDVVTLRRGGTAVAGTFDDPFFFDLNAFDAGFAFCGEEAGDTFAGANAGAFVIEVPTSLYGGAPIGVWGVTRRRRTQFDRHGTPGLTLLDLVPESEQAAFNAARPINDVRDYFGVVSPTVQLYITETTTLAMLVDDLLPDVINFNPALPSGFPNGRRPGDDVMDALLGRLGLGGDCVDGNDVALPSTFPYLGAAHVAGGGTTTTTTSTVPDGSTTTTTTVPGPVVLTFDLGYRHYAFASVTCGILGSTPPLPGASGVVSMSGPGGSGTMPVVLDAGGAAQFSFPITQIGDYSFMANVSGPDGPLVASDQLTVGSAQSACPGQTGRVVFLDSQTGSLPPSTAVCLHRVSGGCTSTGPECLSPSLQLLHLHQEIAAIEGVSGGPFPDPNSTGCGHGIVGDGFPGCLPDTVPPCF